MCEMNLFYLVQVLVFVSSSVTTCVSLSNAQTSVATTSDDVQKRGSPENGLTADVLIPALVCVVVVSFLVVLTVILISLGCCCYWRREIRLIKVKNDGTVEAGEAETVISESNILSKQPKVLSDTLSHDNRRDDGNDGYERMEPQSEGPLTTKDVINGYSLVDGQTEKETNSVDDSHPYFVLEYINAGSVIPDYEQHEYDQPFFEPSTEEEELVCQITDLDVPCVTTSDIDFKEVLGSGQFGTVHKGVWAHEEDGEQVSSEVAIKSMREGATDEDKVKFLQEAAIMGQFSQTNILHIRAIVVEGDSFKLVVDLMHNGDLLKHVASLKQSRYWNNDLTPCEQKQLLMSFSRQIVYGLGYLSVKSYVHRDLAARNVLVAKDGTCKIADFGLSRDLHKENYYKSNGGMVPVKWTAPEAINFRKYSLASDVWSYGCVLYEIWSMGKKPFTHLSNMETIKAVANGYRLPPPPGCPKPIYEFMINCWHSDPDCRPTALEICTTLQRPDYVFLKWQGDEFTIYSPETRTLGEALEYGHCMHKELQKRYVHKQEP